MMDSASPSNTKQQHQPNQHPEPDSSKVVGEDRSYDPDEVQRLLASKDRVIKALESELEKYKLALQKAQADFQSIKQRTQHLPIRIPTTSTADDNIDSHPESLSDPLTNRQDFTGRLELASSQGLFDVITTDSATLETDQQQRKKPSAGSENADAVAAKDSNVSKKSTTRSILDTNRQSISSSICSDVSVSKSKVIFRAGHNDDDDDENIDTEGNYGLDNDLSQSMRELDAQDISENIVGDIITDDLQDVSEINLELEFNHFKPEQKKKQAAEKETESNREKRLESVKNQVESDEYGERTESADEDIISEGLLTSLTDAAISNLSQLAALQERCESQQQSENYQQQQRHSDALAQPRPSSTQQESNSNMSSIILTPEPAHTIPLPMNRNVGQQYRQSSVDDCGIDSETKSVYNTRSSFSAGQSIKNRSTTPLGVNTAIPPALPQNLAASINTHSQHTNSSSSSISPNSTIQSDIGTNSGQSLASVVAAAAIAAAAAANHDQQQQHRPTHQILSQPQSRLISSALPTSEFYHNLQQHSQAQQASFQAQLQQQHQQMSPVTPLSFTQSTSITPSPSSLLGLSRRSASNTSSLLSPIASPNFLRRQFLPDRIPIVSPGGLTTGSSSGASTSLAHILQQHQHHHQSSLQQQRSVSAMAGSMTSPTGTPLSGTGSSVAAISPLMSSKNSSQARLNNMQIRHKFGYLGSSRAQFNSPHGFCLGLNQEIVVADTNNHRVCIFDKSGTYITQFGSPGKEEGQLWNPRKVAILHRPNKSGRGSATSNTTSISDSTHSQSRQSASASSTTYTNHFASEPLYVVCDRGAERSRMQLFTKEGSFIKKIGIHYIDIVAGLAITQDGLIIVVDSVSPTVYIINGETGSLNGWFDCSGHMKEPSDIAVKSDAPGNEYFICDFKGHCVVVFSEQGEYLRKIGHDGLTSYPNGIDISDDGDILVGDSHGNRFHVVVFDRNGNFVSQFECPHVKVSRCCGLKITREGYIVTLAKNNHHVLVLDTIHI